MVRNLCPLRQSGVCRCILMGSHFLSSTFDYFRGRRQLHIKLFEQKGTTHGRPSLLKNKKTTYQLLKHGDKPFLASPVPWSLNSMSCQTVLSAVCSSTLKEWLQIKLSYSTWHPWLNCLLFKDQGGEASLSLEAMQAGSCQNYGQSLGCGGFLC